jgi:hypothetical protein
MHDLAAEISGEDLTADKPTEYAQKMALLNDRLEAAASVTKALEERLKPIEATVRQYMENGDLPEGFKAGGRTFFFQRQLWAGPAESHEALTGVLAGLGLTEYLPKTVNAQSLSAYVRECLDPDKLLPLEQRLASPEPRPLEPELLAALKVTEKVTLKCNKA